MKDNNDFIKSLELISPPLGNHLSAFSEFESDSPTPSFLNFKGLNTFSENISDQIQEDILNSLLLAQRAASKAFPENNQIYDWYHMYFDVLKRLGWLISQKDFTTYEEKSTAFELDKAILSLLQDLLTGQQIKILMQSLDLIKSLGENDRRLQAFANNTQGHQRKNFQLGLAEETNGNIAVLGSGFILESEKKMSKILFVKFNKELINMKFCFYKAELVSSQYENYRELVKQKLGNTEEFITSLDV